MPTFETSPIVGARIRQRRRELGIKQAALAEEVGISASYLNLIEWNKRRIGGKLLNRIIAALDLPADAVAGTSERRLYEALREIAELPELGELGIETDMVGELVGRFPGWARAIAALARAEREASHRAQVLSDRLSNDPFLSETVHRMMTRVAAIRSTTEILNEYDDIPDDQYDRFTRIINDESRALSDVGEALVNYLDKADQSDRVLTPMDEVEAYFDARGNRIEEIEAAAQGLSTDTSAQHPGSRRDRAEFSAQANLSDLIATLIVEAPELKTDAARGRARRILMNYAVGAILMPIDVFAHQAAAYSYDIEALAEAFAVDIDAVCQRLTALPDAPTVPKFGYIRANAAGTVISMTGLRELNIPRYAPACPLWVLFRAQQSPETVIRQRVLFPSGARFVFVARARHWGPTGFGRPRHYLTDMIFCSEQDAAKTIYGPDASAVVDRVGPSCRLCPRKSCEHRVEDPLSE